MSIPTTINGDSGRADFFTLAGLIKYAPNKIQSGLEFRELLIPGMVLRVMHLWIERKNGIVRAQRPSNPARLVYQSTDKGKITDVDRIRNHGKNYIRKPSGQTGWQYFRLSTA